MIIPYDLDVPFERKPFVNWLLTASIAAVFLIEISYFAQDRPEKNLSKLTNLFL